MHLCETTMHVLTANEAGAVFGISSTQVEYTSWAKFGGVSVVSFTMMSMSQEADNRGLPRSYSKCICGRMI